MLEFYLCGRQTLPRVLSGQAVMENNHIKTIPRYEDVGQEKSPDEVEEDITSVRASVLLVGKCHLRETGNAATLHRLRLHVESGGYKCLLIDPEDQDKQEPSTFLSALRRRENIIAVVGLHLYRCASVLLTCKELRLPYMCYLGGTDVNEDVRDPQRLPIMTQVVADAKYLIAFTHDMKEIAHSVWPFVNAEVIKVLPQTVTVNPNKNFDCWSYIERSDKSCDKPGHILSGVSGEFYSRTTNNCCQENSGSHPLHPRDIIENEIGFKKRKCNLNGQLKKDISVFRNVSSVLSSCSSCSSFLSYNGNERNHEIPEEYYPLVVLIAGIRPVKDVLFVADAWSRWHQSRGGRGRLLIIGPALDDTYASKVIQCAASLSGVLIMDKVDPSDCQEVIRCASVLINTSISEGMSAAILEAMALGTPVLARNISGNSAIIKDGVNGLLFDTPDAFVEELQRLLQNTELPKNLTINAMEYLHTHHCAELERKYFLKLLRETVALSGL